MISCKKMLKVMYGNTETLLLLFPAERSEINQTAIIYCNKKKRERKLLLDTKP